MNIQTRNRLRLLAGAATLIVAGLAAPSAWAHRGGHAHFGFYFDPWWPRMYVPGPYYYPPYYPPQVVVTQPPVYVEQAPAAGAAAASSEPGYWHYCADSKAYYPYVKTCPTPWQRVPVQPPANP